MKRIRFLIYPLLFCCIFSIRVQAQTLSGTIDDFSKGYLSSAGSNAALFNGEIQAPLPGGVESLYLRQRGSGERDEAGRELFPRQVSLNESFGVGDILYDGVKYVGVRMRLDLYRDILMASPGDSFIGAILDPSRLGYADLRGYRIIYISADEPPPYNTDFRPGYYLVLHDGPHEILRKERLEFNLSNYEFTGRTIYYYVEKDGAFHRVRARKGSLLSLLRDRRSELDRFIRAEGIDFRRDMERAIVLVVREYERLTGQ
jgi:hypothetical protein